MTLPLRSPPFGRDVSTTDRMRYGVIVTGARLVAEALFRRFTTPKGSLDGHADYGEDLEAYCGRSVTDDELSTIGPKLIAEGRKDERVGRIDVSVKRLATDPSLGFEVSVNGTTKGGEAFELALRVADVVERIRMTGGIDG